MLKKTIVYEDFNGDTVSEDFFFHLSKAELIELEMSQDGGMSSWLQKVVAAEDGHAIIKEFKKIILSAYGQKSSDGRRFIKNQALRDEFESSEAYSTLFVELVTDAELAAEFVNGIIPDGMEEVTAKLAGVDLKVVPDPEPEPVRQVKIVTQAELEGMTHEDLRITTRGIALGEVRIEG